MDDTIFMSICAAQSGLCGLVTFFKVHETGGKTKNWDKIKRCGEGK